MRSWNESQSTVTLYAINDEHFGWKLFFYFLKKTKKHLWSSSENIFILSEGLTQKTGSDFCLDITPFRATCLHRRIY